MLRHFLSLAIIALLVWGGIRFNAYWQSVKARNEAKPSLYAPGTVPGLPAELEASLAEARRGGAEGVKDWLRLHRARVTDPRLAEIDLDYVVLVGPSRPAEARRVLDAVQQRTPTNSPVYPRLRLLDQRYR